MAVDWRKFNVETNQVNVWLLVVDVCTSPVAVVYNNDVGPVVTPDTGGDVTIWRGTDVTAMLLDAELDENSAGDDVIAAVDVATSVEDVADGELEMTSVDWPSPWVCDVAAAAELTMNVVDNVVVKSGRIWLVNGDVSSLMAEN